MKIDCKYISPPIRFTGTRYFNMSLKLLFNKKYVYKYIK